MNGVGIALTVALGVVISLALEAPSAELIEWVTSALFYGLLAGFIFELYRIAFSSAAPTGRR